MQWQASYILYSVHREKKCKTNEFAATLRRNERVRFMLKAVINDLNCILFCQTNVSIPMKWIPEILFPHGDFELSGNTLANTTTTTCRLFECLHLTCTYTAINTVIYKHGSPLF